MNDQFEEKGKIYTNVISKLPVQVTIQTVTDRLHGELYVRPGERLKDELNSSGQFLPLTNVIVYDNQYHEIYRCNFLTLNIKQIVWVIPDEEITTPVEGDKGGNG